MRSMTGFGAAREETSLGAIGVEFKTVNNRFLEFNPRLNAFFSPIEPEIRNAVRAKLARGKVEMHIRYVPSEDAAPPPRVNQRVLTDLVRQLQEVSPDRPIEVERLLSVSGVLETHEDEPASTALAEALLGVVGTALDALEADRAREGETLRAALLSMRDEMRTACERIDAAREDVVAKYRERLKARIDEILDRQGASLDPGRLEQEVALFADKADISEETSRLAAHLDALGDLLAKDGEAVGRQLEFLGQEILRETNTIGSKCRDLDVARDVLSLKGLNESMRELIANVE